MEVRDQSSVERVSQVKRSLESTESEIIAWFRGYRLRDQQRQYQTQLDTLNHQITFLLCKVKTELAGVDQGSESLSVYAKCRAIERRLLWIRRLFGYFQSKFDQRRGDPSVQALLAAADEVVWSCYQQPFRNAGIEKAPPHPLPFVATVYSPYAIPREEPPPELRSDVDAAFLNSMLKQMPISVTGIQAFAVDEPWWLAFLAHECGHHVQFDFNGGSLISAFEQTLRMAGGTRWAGWCKELFADVYSLLMIGSWALWGLAELVWGDAPGMLDDTNPRYPSSLVRLIFMQEVASELGLDGTTAMRGLTAADVLDRGPVYSKNRDLREAAEEDLKAVKNVARSVVTARYDPFGTLAEMTAFNQDDYKPEGAAYLWGEAFRGRANMATKKDLCSARLILGGSVRAWSEIREIADLEERSRLRKDLSVDLPVKIHQNREEITRSVTKTSQNDIDLRNGELAALLYSDHMPGGW